MNKGKKRRGGQRLRDAGSWMTIQILVNEFKAFGFKQVEDTVRF